MSPQLTPYDPLGGYNPLYGQFPQPFLGLDNSGLNNFNPGFYQFPGSYNSNFPFQDIGLNDPLLRSYNDIQRTPFNDPNRNYQFNDRIPYNLPNDPSFRPNRPLPNSFNRPINSFNQPPLDPLRRPLVDPYQRPFNPGQRPNTLFDLDPNRPNNQPTFRPPLNPGQRPNTLFDLDPNRPINQPTFRPPLNPGQRPNSFDLDPNRPINQPGFNPSLDPRFRPNPNLDRNSGYPLNDPTSRPFQNTLPGSIQDYGQLPPGSFNRPNLYSGQKAISDSIYRPVGGLEPRPFSPTLPPSSRFPDPTQRNVLGPVSKPFPPPLNNRPVFVPPRPQSHFSPEYFAEPGYQPSGIESLGRAGPQYSSSSPPTQSKANGSQKLGIK